METALEEFADLVEGVGEVTQRDERLRVYRALGRGELAEGRSLDALQSAYRLGARVAWRRYARVARRAGLSADRMVVLAEAVFAHIEELASASVLGYAEAKADEAGTLGRRRHQLLDLLVAGAGRQPYATPPGRGLAPAVRGRLYVPWTGARTVRRPPGRGSGRAPDRGRPRVPGDRVYDPAQGPVAGPGAVAGHGTERGPASGNGSGSGYGKEYGAERGPVRAAAPRLERNSNGNGYGNGYGNGHGHGGHRGDNGHGHGRGGSNGSNGVAAPGNSRRVRLPDLVLADLDGPDPFLLVPDPSLYLRDGQVQRAMHDRGAVIGPTVPLALSGDSLRWARAIRACLPEPHRGGPVDCDRCLPELLLLGDPTLVRLVADRRLSPLSELTPKRGERLAATLLAWLQTNRGSAPDVAARLGIHPQTARQRLHQVQQLFGPALADPDARFELEVALRSRLMASAFGAPPGPGQHTRRDVTSAPRRPPR